MIKGLIKKGQLWKSKQSGIVLKIINKASGNLHWTAVQVNGGKSHHVHEGTLQKYYQLVG